MSALPSVVDVSGFTLSGKSAVTQLLQEFENIDSPDIEFEFNLFRLKDGLFDLEHALVCDWSPVRSDAALRRFRKLIFTLAGGYRKYSLHWLSSPSGYNYEKLINKDFISLSEDFISSLIDEEEVCYWPFSLHDIHSLDCFKERMQYFLKLKEFGYGKKLLAYGNDFELKTRDYLRALLPLSEKSVFVTNNCFEPFRAKDISRFFDNGKSIVVDRDPRAIYDTALTSPYSGRTEVEDFILNFSSIRERAKKGMASDDVLVLRFENLVLNYNEAVERICDFLNVPRSWHVAPKSAFNPDDSKSRLLKWQDQADQRPFLAIKEQLGEFCFD
jgi:hypothetical protein